VTDEAQAPVMPFSVLWQLAPGCTVEHAGARRFVVRRDHAKVTIEASPAWHACDIGDAARADAAGGLVAPRFRRVERAPFLRFEAAPENRGAAPGPFTTSFRADP
jgi:hypothetical protein